MEDSQTIKGSSIIKGGSLTKDSSSQKAVMIFQNLAEGPEGSPLILYGRKLNSKGQPNNERQLSNKGQLNSKGQLVKKSNDVFFKSRPKAGKLAHWFIMEEISIVKDS